MAERPFAVPTFARSSPLMERAFRFAAERHQGQLRKGSGCPFIVHPVAVARILTQEKMPEKVIAAALLHDVLEDTATTKNELQLVFGKEVTRFVQEVTEPPKKYAWEFKKARYLTNLKRASKGALAIACADKLHNTGSLIQGYEKWGISAYTSFRRPIGKRLAYHLKVYEVIRGAWPGCPALTRLQHRLRRLEGIMKRHPDSEVEAKFLFKGAKVHRALLGLKTLGPLRLNGRTRERQRNTYLDTKQLDLHRTHAALRLRVVQDEAEVTFKSELRYHQGISRRLEINVPIRKTQLRKLFTGSLRIEPVRRARKIAGKKPLKEVLTLSTDRHRLFFSHGKEQVELDVDRVAVCTRQRKGSTHLEVELENLSATEKTYLKTVRALRIRFKGKLTASRVSKYEMGLKVLGLGAVSKRKTK